MVNFRNDLKLETPDNLVKYADASTRCIPYKYTTIRILEKEQTYFTHSYKIGSSSIIGNTSYSNLRVNFKCADEDCQLCEEDYLLEKRYTFLILNRDVNAIQVLDLNKSEFNTFNKYCSNHDIKNLHDDDFYVMANIFAASTLLFKSNNSTNLTNLEIQTIMTHPSNWLDCYLDEFPDYKTAQAPTKSQQIRLPDGSWALRCRQCGFESQWAQPNQSDGSFRCGQCRLLSP